MIILYLQNKLPDGPKVFILVILSIVTILSCVNTVRRGPNNPLWQHLAKRTFGDELETTCLLENFTNAQHHEWWSNGTTEENDQVCPRFSCSTDGMYSVYKPKKRDTQRESFEVMTYHTESNHTIRYNPTNVTVDPAALSTDVLQFTIMNPDFCSSEPNLTLVIYVLSDPERTSNRQTIRQTWGHPQLFTNRTFRVVFMLGQPQDTTLQAEIEREHMVFGDIVQGEFIDSYRNLTVKSIMALNWVSRFCSKVQYVVKTDDDVYLNVVDLQKFLDLKPAFDILCAWLTSRLSPVIRVCKPALFSRWCVEPLIEFPDDLYPPHCLGTAYIMKRHVVEGLQQGSGVTPVFFLEDIYITGILTSRMKDLNVLRLNRRKEHAEQTVLMAQLISPCVKNDAITFLFNTRPKDGIPTPSSQFLGMRLKRLNKVERRQFNKTVIKQLVDNISDKYIHDEHILNISRSKIFCRD